MKAACIWDVLAHILSNLTCNKRNMEFSPQVSISKTNVSTEYSMLCVPAPVPYRDIYIT